MLFKLLKLIFCVLMCLSGIVSFFFNRSHLLLMLMSLEFIMLAVFLLLVYNLGVFGYEYYFLIIYMTFSVVEGVLGLTLLVNVVKLYGNDYTSSISVLW
uniref:NADH-ubiquinone oxidoreductase chain 4L n=1 Tax=Libiocoris heissi TaxID=1176477 RepID=A0A172DYW1_9HEMI|nr:NADH dehydrogenase subunit 4L [Libiocoris heissi]AFI54715.1 NADH dehydrogenase subunit 4L [Libiocoris heissi]